MSSVDTTYKWGLKNITLDALISVFENYPNIEKVILYGSRAMGNYHRGSDIDLTFIGENITLKELLKIENEIDDLLLPYKVDASIFHRINNPDLVNNIERVGQILYQKNATEL